MARKSLRMYIPKKQLDMIIFSQTLDQTIDLTDEQKRKFVMMWIDKMLRQDYLRFDNEISTNDKKTRDIVEKYLCDMIPTRPRKS